MKHFFKIAFIFFICFFNSESTYSQSGVLVFSITPPDNDTDLYIINEDGSGKTKLLQHVGARDFGADWSPDGSKLVFYTHTMDNAHWNIFTIDSDGNNLKQLTFLVDTLAGFPAWSPDGAKIIFSKIFPNQNYRSELWIMNSDGSFQSILTANGDGADWSPDGSKIVFSSDADGDQDVYTMNADGSNIQKITLNNSNDWNPCWSKFGDLIAFTSDRDGNAEIYKMNSDGSNQTRLTRNNFEDLEADWSPDASKIAFVSARDGHYEIYKMDVNGGNETRLTYSNVHTVNPAWKPNGAVDIKTDSKVIPKNFKLFQNYPNPFNPSTKFSYQIPRLSFVSLKIYDVLGREIAVLVNEEKPAGNYEFNFNEAQLTSGIYFYRLQAGNNSMIKKMVILK